MDKSTFSKWGALIVAVLVIAIMISFASPFGQFISSGVKSTLINFKNTTNTALNGGISNEGSGESGGGSGEDPGSNTPSTSFTVTVSSENAEAGTATFTAPETNTTLTLSASTDVTVEATANDGYSFTGWYKDDQLLSKANPYTFTVSDSQNIVAKYKVILEPGLYDANNNLVATWDELVNDYGMNVTYNAYGVTSDTDKKFHPTYVLNNNSNLNSGTKLVIGEVTSISNYAFYNCDTLTSIEIPDSVTTIGYDAFHGCSNLKTVTFGKNSQLTEIKGGTFRACKTLTSIDIPDGVTSIGQSAFVSCSGLTSITISDGVTTIGDYAFDGCSGLTCVSFGENSQLTTIGVQAFLSCSGLTSITIPDSVTSIDKSAFYNCSGLTSITFLSDTPPALGSSALYTTALTEIRVPAASVDAYKTASGWSSYAANIVAID